MAQERIQKAKATTKEEEVVEEVDPQTPENAQAVKDELDALLDEIDSVLEENAMEFVASYIQKGGE